MSGTTFFAAKNANSLRLVHSTPLCAGRESSLYGMFGQGVIQRNFLNVLSDFLVASKFSHRSPSARQSRGTGTHNNTACQRGFLEIKMSQSPSSFDNPCAEIAVTMERTPRIILPVVVRLIYLSVHTVAHSSEDAVTGRGAVGRKRSEGDRDAQSNQRNADAVVIDVAFQPSEKKEVMFDYPRNDLETTSPGCSSSWWENVWLSSRASRLFHTYLSLLWSLLTAAQLAYRGDSESREPIFVHHHRGLLAEILLSVPVQTTWKTVLTGHGADDEGLLQGLRQMDILDLQTPRDYCFRGMAMY
ncbi:hypothetical protein EDD17DRAFT_1509521 [Pisolithus thermaeus]|nr:hypothetical protein EV401DRAFT_2198323 [Pisolithus croceorrhizus]KAI6161041.1 hypothetical protein EDD17DRAFT_1509521 [Pisolithus thermaeus]